MQTQLLISSTLLLSLSPVALSSHKEEEFRRFARQDHLDLDSAVFDMDDDFSALDMTGVRIPAVVTLNLIQAIFIQDMLAVGLKPFLGYLLNGLIVVSLFLLISNILQITLFPLVSAVININYHPLMKMSSSRGFRMLVVP